MAIKRHRISRWGEPPWRIDFRPARKRLPDEVDFAVVGGGFTGLAAAAWLRRLAPEKTVTLLEAKKLGAGASGRTGGIVMEGTASDSPSGLGDVLEGLHSILEELDVECGLDLRGVSEIGRRNIRANSAIDWQDSGRLGEVNEVAGGTLDPGKLIGGLGRAADRLGAIIKENVPVHSTSFGRIAKLRLPRTELRARQVLFATNARSLELGGLKAGGHAMFTMAVTTPPLSDEQLTAIGLAARKPFYTVDHPYLWGRVLAGSRVMFGSGLIHFDDWREMDTLDIFRGRAAEVVGALARRVGLLHPALNATELTHRWGGPILFTPGGRPYFCRHPRSDSAVVLGGYSGHGVALSVYLGCWAAEVLLGRRKLPAWGALVRS